MRYMPFMFSAKMFPESHNEIMNKMLSGYAYGLAGMAARVFSSVLGSSLSRKTDIWRFKFD